MEPAILQGRGGGGGLVPVAVHDQVAAHEDFAVLGDADLDAVQGLPDRGVAGCDGRVDADDRAGLGLAVALQDRHAEGLEEAAQLGVQPGAAADDADDASAEAGGDLAADQAVEDGCGDAVGEGGSAVDTAHSGGKGGGEQTLLPGLFAGHLDGEAGADHLEDAGHHGQDGRTDGLHVGGKLI